MHQCNHCRQFKGIQAFYHSQDEVICQDCYDEQQFDYHMNQAFILHQRKEMKKKLQELDNQEELPF
jgi:recombinational DNA repair protein (RecF pathway)